jgi:hypothetical protein
MKTLVTVNIPDCEKYQIKEKLFRTDGSHTWITHRSGKGTSGGSTINMNMYAPGVYALIIQRDCWIVTDS